MEKNNITDWMQIFFTLIAGCYALYLLNQNNRLRRKQYIFELYNTLHNDDEIMQIIYSVDKNRETNEIRFNGKLEKQADKTLRYFDFIGLLIKDRDLIPHDIIAFQYVINRVLKNEDVKKYIKWLEGINVNLDNLKYL